MHRDHWHIMIEIIGILGLPFLVVAALVADGLALSVWSEFAAEPRRPRRKRACLVVALAVTVIAVGVALPPGFLAIIFALPAAVAMIPFLAITWPRRATAVVGNSATVAPSIPHAQPMRAPPVLTDRSLPSMPWQFTFWTLAELVTGCSLMFALIAEMKAASILVIGPAALLLFAAVCYSFAPDRATKATLVIAFGVAIMCNGCYGFALVAEFVMPGFSDKECQDNLQKIAHALSVYHDQFGSFPPPEFQRENPSVTHSWRTALLPQLSGQDVYDNFDLAQSWNHPNNIAAAARWQQGHVTACDRCFHWMPHGTNYFMVVGPGRQPADGQPLRLQDIRDDPAQTILLVESDSVSVNWFQPGDLTVDQVLQGINPPSAGMSSRHRTGGLGRRFAVVHVAFADGSVRELPETIDRETLRALLTIDGGEQIDPVRLKAPSHTGPVVWLVLLTICFIPFVIVRHCGQPLIERFKNRFLFRSR